MLPKKSKLQKLLPTFALLLTIFLSGCQSPREIIVKQKFIHFEYIAIDGKQYIDPDLSFCLTRDYKYSIHFVGPINKFKDLPLVLCDKMTGETPTEYVEKTNFLEDARREIESHE